MEYWQQFQPELDRPERIDSCLARISEHSRNQIARLIRDGRVLVDDCPVDRTSQRISGRPCIQVQIPEPQSLDLVPQRLSFGIRYEDSDLMVIDKPAGLVVHPAPGSPDNTLVNGLLAHLGDGLQAIGGELRPGIVHRLDKDTSGLMLVAVSARAQEELSRMFAGKEIQRSYLALVQGKAQDRMHIRAPIGRDPRDRKRMAVVSRGGRDAGTRARCLYRWRLAEHWASLVLCRLETGRTHQIRVHMRHAGLPLLGDAQYGSRRAPGYSMLKRQALHSWHLGFRHPLAGHWMEFRQPVPADMCAQIRHLNINAFVRESQGGLKDLEL